MLYELFPTLYLFIGTLGAIYLVYLGVSGLFGSTTKADSTTRKGYRWSDFAEPCRRYLGEVEEEEVEQVNEEPTVEEQVELF